MMMQKCQVLLEEARARTGGASLVPMSTAALMQMKTVVRMHKQMQS